ncbi:hypothetical protein ACFOD4_19330 [Pseudoroseomonas globiformis]|uniref:Uncharacterized protein n=1 Tax=Teichococcus globiformis TaxID=2307229 RepID=A0ABV7G9D2_9PROT
MTLSELETWIVLFRGAIGDLTTEIAALEATDAIWLDAVVTLPGGRQITHPLLRTEVISTLERTLSRYRSALEAADPDA